ncbi:hypothetical protein [Bariatricus sp. SGI.019]|uniref:hypothetical protein n=1 Tax=Bariatricus sp. SGI.019 TaxID=3420548 RepID=UPI003D0253E1
MLNKKDTVYYTRIIPNCGIYDVLELKIRTVTDTYFVGVEKRDKQCFLLSYNDIGKIVFKDRKDAVMKVKEAEEHKKVISDEILYEEY